MLKETRAALRWYAELGAKFFKVSPWETLAAITLTFFAQLALIASLLLPLKIVMIMSSGNIPNILPSAFDSVSENVLISALAAVAIGAFLFNSVATKTIENLAARVVATTQQRAGKLALFENQDHLAQHAVLKFTEAVASLLFVIAGFTTLIWLYWELAAVAVIFVTTCLAICSLIWAKSDSQWAAISSQLGKNLNYLSSVGFFILFLTIVIDYMVATIPGFISVLLSIILSRQLLSQTASGINNVYFLQINQPKIRAIVFENCIDIRSYGEKQGSVWNYLTNEVERQELIEKIANLSGANVSDIDTKWMDSGLHNILHFIFEVGSTHQKYLLKIFDKNKTTKARHEATLLLTPPENLPSPKLVTTIITKKQFHIHIFDISGYVPLPTSLRKNIHSDLSQILTKIKPSFELIEQYQRSRLMIWRRIDHKLLEKIISAGSGEREFIDRAGQFLPQWEEQLKALPVRIHNHFTNLTAFMNESDGQVLSSNWTEWSIEPSDHATEHDDHTLSILYSFRKLEQATKKQRYSEAFKTLKLLFSLEECKKTNRH